MLLVYKPLGFTPLQTILRLKEQYPEYSGRTISYAGRLDPMAEGLLLLLVDDENKKRKDFEAMKKTYDFTVLLGVETDTYDILGKVNINSNIEIRNSKSAHTQIKNSSVVIASDFDIRISDLLYSFVGKRLQSYPPYSSKTVQGKPLYWWAREGRLHEIEIPAREVEIYSIALEKVAALATQDLQKSIFDRIKNVEGNFRQEEIMDSWQSFFHTTDQTLFQVLLCRITCSSGTYVRSICHELGQQLGGGGIAFSINRTAIGSYTAMEALRLI
jgi:tRNA pseudouridine55 synthase